MESGKTTWPYFPNADKATEEQRLVSEPRNESKGKRPWELQSGVQVGHPTNWVKLLEMWVLPE